MWKSTTSGGVVCNTDGASRGNPSQSAYSFCIRNEEGNLLFMEAKCIGIATNIEAEARVIMEALNSCVEKDFSKVLVQTDSPAIR